MAQRVTPDAAIPLVEDFWDIDGYFFKLRQGDYAPGGAERFESVIRSIDVSDGSRLPRRLVSLTWMVPTFMEWQVERVMEKGGDVDGLRRDITMLRNALNELLGAP